MLSADVGRLVEMLIQMSCVCAQYGKMHVSANLDCSSDQCQCSSLIQILRRFQLLSKSMLLTSKCEVATFVTTFVVDILAVFRRASI